MKGKVKAVVGKEKPKVKKKGGIIQAIKMELKGGGQGGAGHARRNSKELPEKEGEWEWSNQASCAAHGTFWCLSLPSQGVGEPCIGQME